MSTTAPAAVPATGSDADAPSRIDAAWFAADVCRNCGAALPTPFCGACGQKRAGRLGWGSLGSEAWQNLRVFELELVRSALRLALKPGVVAREYVLGVRKKHVHPLKLLLVAVALLLLMLAETAFARGGSAELSRAMQLAQQYGKWSFSLGLVAILAASLCVFPRRMGANFTEHLVLAVYAQFLVLLANVANLAPLLWIDGAAQVRAYRAAAAHYMGPIETAIVVVALMQFFRANPRREWWRALLAAAVFLATKHLLLLAYGRVLARVIRAQLA